MKYLIADTVLEGFTWRGTVETKKKPFKQLVALNNLIFESVKHQFKAYKKIDYKNYLVNNWLKHSRTRQRIVTYQYPTRHQRNDEFDVEENELEEEDDQEEND